MKTDAPLPYPYRACLVRCWKEETILPDESPVWRFMLQEIPGEQRRWGFSRFEDLVEHLRASLMDGQGKTRN